MRQAGRSLPEYRDARAGTPMLKACAQPDLITEFTLQPLRRYAVDAAILFSDIVVPLRAVGVSLEISPGVGPVVEHPIRDAGDVERLRELGYPVRTAMGAGGGYRLVVLLLGHFLLIYQLLVAHQVVLRLHIICLGLHQLLVGQPL